ncbi:hypothetical protein WJX81_005889 [Elliptochloris bilobata]|uniref:Stress-response A/B barrel domain-containing protein n=1 Tax=Elliptochloris bilobata TaxID=381761 RepID=A0AAW1RVN8_9CHLO
MSRCSCSVTTCSISARWCIDIRYGVKLDAAALLQDWVRDIGSKAGLGASNAQILSGAVGVPESRLELEVEFESLAELEQFWAAIPAEQHRAWSQRAQNLIIDGSPRWEVYRTVPVEAQAGLGDSSTPAATTPRPPGLAGGAPLWDARGQQSGAAPELLIQPAPAEAEPKIILDWKGDPMIINPNDNMPFF